MTDAERLVNERQTMLGVDDETFRRGPLPNDPVVRTAWQRLHAVERWAMLALRDGAVMRTEQAEDLVLARDATLFSVEWSDGRQKWGAQYCVSREEAEDDVTGVPLRTLMKFWRWLQENPMVGRPEEDRGAAVALKRMEERGLA